MRLLGMSHDRTPSWPASSAAQNASSRADEPTPSASGAVVPAVFSALCWSCVPGTAASMGRYFRLILPRAAPSPPEAQPGAWFWRPKSAGTMRIGLCHPVESSVQRASGFGRRIPARSTGATDRHGRVILFILFVAPSGGLVRCRRGPVVDGGDRRLSEIKRARVV
jgi:hypothetical protein